MTTQATTRRVSGGLLQVLGRSRVAWYQGDDGTTVYYEQPSAGVPGLMVVNGEPITKLVVDPQGHYADLPSPQVQHLLLARGVHLANGWTCLVEIYGSHINEAVGRSRYRAVRHHNGQVSVQCTGEHDALIFVHGIQRWKIKLTQAHQALAEMGVVTSDGWYPVDHDLAHLQSPQDERGAS